MARIVEKKAHVEVHGLKPNEKADLVRIGVPMTTLVSGAVLIPINPAVGVALATVGTALSGILGISLRNKLINIFKGREQTTLKKVI